jgi:hypothetical protein
LKASIISLSVLAALLLPGCPAEQAYSTGQAWQRNQCSKIPDKAEFDRCMSNTQTTYDSYKQQREPERK